MFLFLIKASLIIALLWVFYKLFLERESFFIANRIYLLACLVLALTLPFVTLPKMIQYQGVLTILFDQEAAENERFPTDTQISQNESNLIGEEITIGETDVASEEIEYIGNKESVAVYHEATEQQIESAEQQIEQQESPDEILVSPVMPTQNSERPISFWLLGIYLFGVVVLAIHLMAQIIGTLIRVFRNEDKVIDEEGILVNMEGNVEPCSFFHYIFINPEQYDFETYEQIVAHEKIHVKLWHSIDLLLSELAVVFFWFNPFVWLLRKEVEKNIEYQTDHEMTTHAVTEKKGYQMNLLKIATYNKPLTITTNYNQSLIKQRILKMNTKKSNPYSYWKYAFVAPIVFLMLLGMNEPYDKTLSIADDSIEQQAVTNGDFERFMQAIKNDNIDAVRYYLNKGVDIHGIDENGVTPLLLATMRKHKAIAKLLTGHIIRDAGLNLNIESDEVQVITPKTTTTATPDTGFAQLMQAIEHNDIKAVKAYLKKGINIYQADDNGFTPLLLAAYKEHGEIARLLTDQTLQAVGLNLQEGDGVQIKDRDHDVDFHFDGNFHFDDNDGYFSENKIDWDNIPLDSIDYDNFDLFMGVVKDGNTKLVEYFINNGVDVNEINNNYRRGEGAFTPLMMAAHEDHPEIARLLINKGANVNYINANGWTALIEAADEGAYATTVVLLEAGADVNLHDKHRGRSAVTMAASEGHTQILELLLEEGADLSLLNDGYPPLQVAAEEGQLNIIELLLQKGIDINMQDHHGLTALAYAAAEGKFDVARYLVEKGATIDTKDENNRTPLMYAVEEGEEEIIRLLLDKGADIAVKDKNGHTVLDYAVESNDADIMVLIIEKQKESGIKIGSEYGINALIEAVDDGNRQMIDQLLEQGVDANGKNNRGWTPLMEAADEANLSLVKLLVEKGANVNAQSNFGWTALMEAVDEEAVSMVKYLIQEGANINAATVSQFRDDNAKFEKFTIQKGWTPLFEAIDQSNPNIAEILIKNGANVNAEQIRTFDSFYKPRRQINNWTPLMDAVQQEQLSMVELLVSNGANVNALIDGKESILSMAKQTGNNAIITFLEAQAGTEQVSNDLQEKQLRNETDLKIESLIGGSIKVSLNLRRDTPLTIEILDLNNQLIKTLVKGKFRGNVGSNWKPEKKSGTYLLKIVVDGEATTIKIGDGTEYPWR